MTNLRRAVPFLPRGGVGAVKIKGSQGAANLERCCGAAGVILPKITRVVQSTRWASVEDPLPAEVVACVRIISLEKSGNTSEAESGLDLISAL